MSARHGRGRAAALLFITVIYSVQALGAEPLLVCADERSLPFSDIERRGFENVLAQMIASDLRRPLEFVWKFRKGYPNVEAARSPFCGIVLGMPVGQGKALLTAPYYRSTYVFVTRKDRFMGIRSFADPRLSGLRIGILGGSAAVDLTPPGRLATAYGLTKQVRAFRSRSPRGEGNPAQAMVEALARSEIDIAVGWGPAIGYFAARSLVPLTIQAVSNDPTHPDIAMSYAIAIAVPPGNRELRTELDAFLARRAGAIAQLLSDYHVPLKRAIAPTAQKSPPVL